jgi:hypothetical protein
MKILPISGFQPDPRRMVPLDNEDIRTFKMKQIAGRTINKEKKHV